MCSGEITINKALLVSELSLGHKVSISNSYITSAIVQFQIMVKLNASQQVLSAT